MTWSATGHGPPPAFRHDADVVYAPHIYTGGFTNGPITAEAFQVARDEARGFGGAPVLSGEWGSGPERAGTADDYFAAHQALQDRFRISATLWTWRESCGDPHKVGDLRAGPDPRGVGALRRRLPHERRPRRPHRARRGADARLRPGRARAPG